jgi:hypothetical protein
VAGFCQRRSLGLGIVDTSRVHQRQRPCSHPLGGAESNAPRGRAVNRGFAPVRGELRLCLVAQPDGHVDDGDARTGRTGWPTGLGIELDTVSWAVSSSLRNCSSTDLIRFWWSRLTTCPFGRFVTTRNRYVFVVVSLRSRSWISPMRSDLLPRHSCRVLFSGVHRDVQPGLAGTQAAVGQGDHSRGNTGQTPIAKRVAVDTQVGANLTGGEQRIVPRSGHALAPCAMPEIGQPRHTRVRTPMMGDLSHIPTPGVPQWPWPPKWDHCQRHPTETPTCRQSPQTDTEVAGRWPEQVGEMRQRQFFEAG